MTKFLSLVWCTCTPPLSGSARSLLFASLCLCLHFLPSLSFLYFTMYQIKFVFFQLYSLRLPGEGPVESAQSQERGTS